MNADTDLSTPESRLRTALLGDRPHHAIVFAGPDTAAKIDTARRLAADLLIRLTPEVQAQNIRDRVHKDMYPDVLWVKEEEEDSIRIDTIRDVCHQMEIAPLESGGKICIVQDAHRLNMAASNAFLKTLEEPLPNRFFWLMTSQVGNLLPTLLSRCLVVVFPPTKEEPVDLQSPHWKGFSDAWASNQWESFADSLKDKPEASGFVRSLQTVLRSAALDAIQHPEQRTGWFSDCSVHEILRKYERTVRLEAELKTNASTALLLEDTLSELRKAHL